MHATPFAYPIDIKAGDYFDTRNSGVIVMCASVPVKDIKSWEELSQENYKLFKEIVPILAQQSPEAIFLIVTNPVDVMTYLTLKLTKFPKTRVIGTGTLLDSGRFRSLLADSSGANASDINAYIIGEHGDTQLPVLSSANIGGRFFRDVDKVLALFHKAREEGQIIFEHKGFTNFSVGLAAVSILESLVFDTRHVLPVSLLIENYFGVSDVCLSVPAVLGRNGIHRVIDLDLNQTEQEQFKKSAETVKELIKTVKT
jgi:L-lactate dehydrogenase